MQDFCIASEGENAKYCMAQLIKSDREQSWMWWAGEAPLLCYLGWALCMGLSKVVSADLTRFPLKSLKKLFLTSLEAQQAELRRAQSQVNAETINLKTRKEMPDVSPRRNVKHAQEWQRAFVKEAAICPVETWEMLSPPTWAWGFSHKAKWLSLMETAIKAEGDAHIPAATQLSWRWHNSPSWKWKPIFPTSLQIPTELASSC